MRLILFFILLSFVIRTIPVFQNAISFHYDMARDAFIAKEILMGDLKIQGPPTSTPGLYHGVFYYYLIAPFYFFASGDPRIAAVFMAIINSLTVIPIILLTKSIFKNLKLTVISGLLFAVAFEATEYALWLSNPSPAIFTVSLFFYSLWFWLKGSSKHFYLAIFAAALSTQFQLFLLYLFFVIGLFYFIFRPTLTKKDFIFGLLIVCLTLGSFFIAALKFHSIISAFGGFLGIASTNPFDFRIQFSELFLDYANRYLDIFINNFTPTNIFIGGILGIVITFLVRKNRFILFCLLSTSFLFVLGGHNSAYVNVGMITPAILGLVFLLQKLMNKSKIAAYLLVIFIVIFNIQVISKSVSRGQLALVIPKDMVLNKQLALIDKTYELANYQPFSINTLTLPLWTNTTWSYLYSWYGLKKYGYVPSFHGRDQIGLLGSNDLQKTLPSSVSFFIIEPEVGIPQSFFASEIESENGKTKMLKEIKFEGLRLQQRTLIQYE